MIRSRLPATTRILTRTDGRCLLKQLQLGKEAALTRIYRRLERPLYRFAYAMKGSRAMAEESVQEALSGSIRQPGGLDPAKGSIESYLERTTTNRHPALRIVRLGEPPPRSSVCPPTLSSKTPPQPCSCCGSEATKSGKNSFSPRAAQAILSWSRPPCHFLLKAHLS